MRIDRTKMFHVKHFGTIDARGKRTFARRARSVLSGIFFRFGKSRLGGASNTPHEYEPTYGRINTFFHT